MEMLKRLRRHIQEMRPNVLWDAVKFVFGQVYGIAVVGIVGMFAVISGLLQKIRGMPLDWIALGVLTLFSLASIIVGVTVGRRKSKETLFSSVDLALQPSAQNVTRDSNNWLQDIAESDRKEIRRLVMVVGCELNDYYLKERLPYILFTFTFVNVSVYKISIEDSLRGFIYFGGQELRSSPRIEQHHIKNFPHGGKGDFTVRQPLDEGEAKFFYEASNTSVFSFDNVVINFMIDLDQEPKPLKLPRQFRKDGYTMF